MYSYEKDFNSFFAREPKRALLKWTNDLNDGVPLWRRILLCLSGVAAFTNVLNVVLVIRGKLSSFFWGIIGAILYGTYAFAYGYVGDAQLYVLFFLPMQFVGIYIWSKQLDNQSTTRVKSLKLLGWLLILVLCVGLGFLFYYEIPAFAKLLTSQYFFETNFVAHLFDASTNAISVVAQFLLILCYWEQYILWATVNVIGIVMYSDSTRHQRAHRVDHVGNQFSCWSILMVSSMEKFEYRQENLNLIFDY
ncbi:unnamed protein product [Adineta ricciae]|uniref:Nicotinamide riboside transporter PnuC n=1 Tax=Adineta ricciae TaxID=249248 RepID=A0A815ESA3_ADIRI|nr:unnamed protein product [Adineta ricciae]